MSPDGIYGPCGKSHQLCIVIEMGFGGAVTEQCRETLGWPGPGCESASQCFMSCSSLFMCGGGACAHMTWSTHGGQRTRLAVPLPST